MDNPRGIALMVLSMALFAMGDAAVKLASATMGPGQVTVWLLGGAIVIFYSLARYNGERLWDLALLSPAVLGRCASEGIGTFGMITAFALAPLATVAAILQASPLVVTMLAALFLAEPVGWRRWSAIGIGFLGVMLIIRPGTDGFAISSLYAVIGMLALSFRDFFTRITPKQLPTTTLAAWTLLTIYPFAVLWALVEGNGFLPTDTNWTIILAMILFGAGGYYAITKAVRIAEISAVAPFRYTRLLFAIFLGILIFNDWPDTWMLAGSALILGSGLYAMLRERKIAKTLHTEASGG
ncbi:MAG: DMT family transporter [Rhodobacteraceae bacterium]|nr:DMT family transporter [Paracoccaceae bacterium]